jgi:hypothetical protein
MTSQPRCGEYDFSGELLGNWELIPTIAADRHHSSVDCDWDFFRSFDPGRFEQGLLLFGQEFLVGDEHWTVLPVTDVSFEEISNQ